MTARGATAAFIAEAALSRNEPVRLFEAFFDSGTIYATDAPFPISWEGNTYTALGHLLQHDGIDENPDLYESRVRVMLSGIDQTWVSTVLSENYIDRRLVIRQAFLVGPGVLVDPVPIFDGFMDAPSIQEDPTGGGDAKCSVTFEAGAHWSDFGRRPGRHTNDNEQQFYFPGDSFFEFVSEINKPITWGGVTQPAPSAPVAPAGGGSTVFGENPSTGSWGWYEPAPSQAPAADSWPNVIADI